MRITKGNKTYIGITEKDGHLVCEKCQNREAKVKRVMYLDGAEDYEDHYQCECGNLMAVIAKRDKNDPMYWGEVWEVRRDG